MLIKADLGLATAAAITDALRAGRYDKEIGEDEVKAVLAAEIEKTLLPGRAAARHRPAPQAACRPRRRRQRHGQDHHHRQARGEAPRRGADGRGSPPATPSAPRPSSSSRSGAQRTGAHVVARETGADAAGLAFDALRDARDEGADVLLVDTAGRLQNKDELMAELEKIIRVIRKIDPTAPHTVLLTLDATTGQNALNQVEVFGKRAGVSGLVMTKLDGTARGGILVAIAAKYKLPVHFIGVGEQVDDLEPFKAGDFARALAGL